MDVIELASAPELAPPRDSMTTGEEGGDAGDQSASSSSSTPRGTLAESYPLLAKQLMLKGIDAESTSLVSLNASEVTKLQLSVGLIARSAERDLMTNLDLDARTLTKREARERYETDPSSWLARHPDDSLRREGGSLYVDLSDLVTAELYECRTLAVEAGALPLVEQNFKKTAEDMGHVVGITWRWERFGQRLVAYDASGSVVYSGTVMWPGVPD